MGEIMTQNQFQKVKDTMKETVKNISKKMPTLDKEAMMNSHKKNMEALTEANKMAIEVMKSLAHLQSQYVKQTFEDISPDLEWAAPGAANFTPVNERQNA